MWGRGEYGRLGLGDKGGSSRLRPCRVKAMEGHRVIQASCGGTHTMVLTAEGRIFGWGRGSFGRLGTGHEKDHHSPVEIFLPGQPLSQFIQPINRSINQSIKQSNNLPSINQSVNQSKPDQGLWVCQWVCGCQFDQFSSARGQ